MIGTRNTQKTERGPVYYSPGGNYAGNSERTTRLMPPGYWYTFNDMNSGPTWQWHASSFYFSGHVFRESIIFTYQYERLFHTPLVGLCF